MLVSRTSWYAENSRFAYMDALDIALLVLMGAGAPAVASDGELLRP